ncbi:hypothetical protein Tco_1527184 [Tanacetum coccineum]
MHKPTSLITHGFLTEKEYQQLLKDEEVLRETLKEQARAEKEWEDRIKKEEAKQKADVALTCQLLKNKHLNFVVVGRGVATIVVVVAVDYDAANVVFVVFVAVVTVVVSVVAAITD